ncbi:hypothetical protein QBC43DRAFT_293785 [Cladorrhinum sp. PSN259]|nr:hypothetical protein QBC43DRAFT_293785 [Cladorrhinum sp. PSN259]
MAKGKMDDAAAARIRRARGPDDDFARRAANSAKKNSDASKSAGGDSGKKDSAKKDSAKKDSSKGSKK